MPPSSTVPLGALFLVFARIGLFSFGGGLSGWIYREVVLMRPWLTEEEFLSGTAISQILPGANVTNLSVFIGQKLRGVPGAVTALFGLLVGPFFAVIALASAYDVIRALPWAENALDGIAAAAIGLLLLISYKSGRRAAGKLSSFLAFLATFIGVGVLRLPFIPVVICVGVVSVFAAWPREQRSDA